MSGLLQVSVQDEISGLHRKHVSRRLLPAPSSIHRLQFLLICGFIALEFSIASATVMSIELVYHHVVYGSAAAILEPSLGMSIAAAYTAIYAFRFGYVPVRIRHRDFASVVTSWCVAVAIVVIVAFFVKVSDLHSRGSTIAIVIVAPIVLMLARCLVVRLLHPVARIEPYLFRRVLLIGSTEHVAALGGLVDRYDDCRVVASFCLRPHEAGEVTSSNEDYPDIHLRQDDEDIELAKSLVRLMRPTEIVLALPLGDAARIRRIVDRLGEAPASISLYLREIFDDPEATLKSEALDHRFLRMTRGTLTLSESLAKRLFDIIFASLGLVLLAPLMLAVAIAVKLDSSGPVFFSQTRYGFNWMQFTILKFRTMRVQEDGRVVKQATRNDPRVTRVGAFLRRTNIDELPQLFNVLIGQMSLVGPRPHAMSHDIAFVKQLAHYSRRHNAKPGITGWAQVNGYRGEIEGSETLRQRLLHDLHYIDNWSFWLDLKIVFLTVFSPRAYRNAR